MVAVAAKLAEFKQVLASASLIITKKSSAKVEREQIFLGKQVDFGLGPY